MRPGTLRCRSSSTLVGFVFVIPRRTIILIVWRCRQDPGGREDRRGLQGRGEGIHCLHALSRECSVFLDDEMKYADFSSPSPPPPLRPPPLQLRYLLRLLRPRNPPHLLHPLRRPLPHPLRPHPMLLLRHLRLLELVPPVVRPSTTLPLWRWALSARLLSPT